MSHVSYFIGLSWEEGTTRNAGNAILLLSSTNSIEGKQLSALLRPAILRFIFHSFLFHSLQSPFAVTAKCFHSTPFHPTR